VDTYRCLPTPLQSCPKEKRRTWTGDGPRRRYSVDFKLKVLQEAMAPGASVAAVARRHGLNTNLIFRWRKLFQGGRSSDADVAGREIPALEFIPVRVLDEAPAGVPPPEKADPCRKSGVMAITLPGGITLRVREDIDEAALRRVLRAARNLE
jgi:transposase